ncbi:short-chain dehydrogenase/reductase SDR [Hyaloraphidium curvatum]|nr:short-chain dehydrogenase/reductase SDR [Hyaloraphidium curvatum]
MGFVGVIVGGTRGIGHALAKALAEDVGSGQGGGVVYLTARNDESGRKAVETIPVPAAGNTSVKYLVADLSDPSTLDSLAEYVRKEHPGGLDALVINGAYAARPGVPAAEDAPLMIRTNNQGTVHLLRSFPALMKPGGRILVVASGFGLLKTIPGKATRDHFRAAIAKGDVSGVGSLMDEYVAKTSAGTETEEWGGWVNGPSKVGQVAALRALATSLASQPPSSRPFVMAVCPGWTYTDAAGPYIAKSEDLQKIAKQPDEAAAYLLGYVKEPKEEWFGELVQYNKILPFDEGKP